MEYTFCTTAVFFHVFFQGVKILPYSSIKQISFRNSLLVSILICFLAVIKARILSAHDKGTHAEVVVKVKKVLKSGKVKIARSNRSIYPESWTNRGCTCPILNPGKDKMLTRYFPSPVNSADNSLRTLAMATERFPSVFLEQSPLIRPHQRGSQ